jgi:hypothetical protein
LVNVVGGEERRRGAIVSRARVGVRTRITPPGRSLFAACAGAGGKEADMVSQVEWERKLEREVFHAAGRDGVRVTFGVLADGHCAVVRGGAVTDVWEAAARGIAAATNRFSSLTTPLDPTRAKPRPDVVRARGNITRLIPQLP